MAPGITNIYFLDLGRKIENSFGLRGDGFLNSLLPGDFLTAILLGLGTNKEPQAVTR